MKANIAYVDGGCDNKTKSHAYGSFVILGKDQVIASQIFLLPAKTSNEAEYMSLIKLLKFIKNLTDYQRNKWIIYSDSKLVVKQVTNGWRVHSPNLKELNKEAIKLYNSMGNVSLFWVSRKEVYKFLGH